MLIGFTPITQSVFNLPNGILKSKHCLKHCLKHVNQTYASLSKREGLSIVFKDVLTWVNRGYHQTFRSNILD